MNPFYDEKILQLTFVVFRIVILNLPINDRNDMKVNGKLINSIECDNI